MEQDSGVYEFRMGEEHYVFEAHGPKEAAKYQKYALLHFRERLGERFSERALEGPFAKTEAAGPAPSGHVRPAERN